MFADFDSKTESSVPVYVINRTASPVTFKCQDGDIFLKLEGETSGGDWERAQAHESSNCGVSYYGIKLGPGQHFKLRGYSPSTGNQKQVRYKIYEESNALVSNAGAGLVLDRDVEDSRRDDIGRSIPNSLEDLLVRGTDVSRPVGPEKFVAAMQLALASGDNPYYRTLAENVAKEWESAKVPSEEKTAAARKLREIAFATYPPTKDRAKLFDRCLAAMDPKSDKSGFADPGKFPDLVVSVVRELAEKNEVPDLRKWRDWLEMADARADGETDPMYDAILSSPYLSDELISNDYLVQRLQKPLPNVDQRCQLLAQRGRSDLLVEIGQKAEPSRKLEILRALVSQRVADDTWFDLPEDEEKFWRQCFVESPIEASEAVCQKGNVQTESDMREFAGTPLRTLIVTEAAIYAGRRDNILMDDSKLSKAVTFLGKCNDPNDNKLLRSLLEFRGYEIVRDEDGSGKPAVRIFAVREAAKQALEDRGEKISENLVVEKPVQR
jgi:hypothetical protein